jgi:hypothetical protein
MLRRLIHLHKEQQSNRYLFVRTEKLEEIQWVTLLSGEQFNHVKSISAHLAGSGLA